MQIKARMLRWQSKCYDTNNNTKRCGEKNDPIYHKSYSGQRMIDEHIIPKKKHSKRAA